LPDGQHPTRLGHDVLVCRQRDDGPPDVLRRFEVVGRLVAPGVKKSGRLSSSPPSIKENESRAFLGPPWRLGTCIRSFATSAG
jgi:hypothetical protein